MNSSKSFEPAVLAPIDAPGMAAPKTLEEANRCIRDVIALSTLPNLWLQADPVRMAESLAAALHTTVSPAVTYVGLTSALDGEPIQIVYTGRYETDPDLAAEIGPAIFKQLRTCDAEEPLRLRNPGDGSDLSFCLQPLGFDAEYGAVALGFDAPAEFGWLRRTLLQIAANQAAVACQHNRLMQSLRQSHDRFRALVEASAQIVWTTDSQGELRTDSPSWRAFTGQTYEQLEGSGWVNMLHPEDRERVLAMWREAIREKAPVHTEYRLRHVSGDWRWTAVRAVPVLCEDGSVREWVGMNADISDAKAAEATLRERTARLENVNRVGHTLASELDLERIVQTVTDAGREISGAQFGAFFYNVRDEHGESYMLYSLSGAPRKMFEGFGMPRNTPLFAHTFNGEGILRIGDVTRDPRYGKNAPHHGMPKGHLPVRSYLAVPVTSRSGEVLGGLFFGHGEPDVFSEASEASLSAIAAQAAIAIDNANLYQALLRSNEELEQRVELRTKELRETNEQLEAFVYSIAHDLRAPLRSMHAFSCMLLEDYAAKLDKDGQFYARRIKHSATWMDRLLLDLLDYGRIARSEPCLTTACLEAAVNAALVQNEQAIQETQARLEISDRLPAVLAHEATLGQVLSNLVSNAIKFVAPGVTPDVRIWSELCGDKVRLFVQDNGIGIPEIYKDQIFKIFERLHGTEYGGTGIGLSIVRKGIERMGGCVGVESAPGHGTRFWIELEKAEKGN